MSGTAIATVAPARGALDPQGPIAEAMAELWWLMLVLGVVVFLAFAVLLGIGLFTDRTEIEPTELPETNTVVRRWIIGGGVVMPFVVIVVVFAATLIAMREVPSEADPDALTIELTGHQFWYEVRYPEHGIVTANEIHLPVGRQVVLELVSADVIHSFWIPPLGGKLDMMPERTNTLVLEADEPGEHRSKCAEFCGLQHTRMGLIAVVEPEEDFGAWVEEQQQVAGEGTGEAADRGREIFLGADCASCHAAPGVESGGRAPAPDLTTLHTRRTIGAAMLPNTRDNVADWITDPQAIKTGVKMPATDLSREELDAVLSYLGYDGE